ncbi:MAG: hypothetical protein J0G33_02750 [Afipia felis]|nr:hypothetical protein [Afipia felis]
MLTPKNWSSFQHYKDRSPSWIKLHKGLLDDFEFNRLPLASRALAPMLWLLASEYEEGQISASTAEIAFRFRLSVEELEAALMPLIDSGFFLASDLLAERRQDACLEKRREEVEKETDSRSVAKAIRLDASRFEEFWQAYPRRDGPNPRKPAEQRFNSLVKSGVDPKTMIDAASELCEAERKRGNIGTRFIPQAITWLNQQRWSDHAAVAMVQALAAVENLSKKFHVKADTPQWRAWTAHLGKPPPQDKDFGWYFDSEWPPMQHEGQA